LEGVSYAALDALHQPAAPISSVGSIDETAPAWPGLQVYWR
jgi:hypothetical protein